MNWLGYLKGRFRDKSKSSRDRALPIFILGNQKSGTSAIAHLLADYGSLSKTIDIPESWWPTLVYLLSGELSLADFARQHRDRFSTDIVKEPNLTFLYPQLRELYPQAKFIFVVRDPRDNIRSLLNRMGIAGNLERIDLREQAVSRFWRPIFDTRLWKLETESEHYIEVLAARWNRAVDVYLDCADEMILVRYEDFEANKYGAINDLALKVGVPQRFDIGGLVDNQYQPRGNRCVTWEQFFGQDNLACIERICCGRKEKLGYS